MEEVAQKIPDVYSYILQEEESFRTERIPLASNWKDWNMYEHVDRSFQLKNSKFYLGQQDFKRPFNNILLPILNVSYRTEGFDVKDVQLYVDNPENYYKSFVARKFHNWYAIDNHLDTAIDESVESYVDYGLVLMKKSDNVRPEVVQLQQIAFCDQTDVLSGPICLRHYLSVTDLLDMKDKWDSNQVDKTVLMAKTSTPKEDGGSVKTPGKYVTVYELHGLFPESWLGAEVLGEDWEDTGKYSPQLHVITYYVSPNDATKKVGVTLYKGSEPKPIFKALKRDPIYGRACGRGGIEELFHPQIWTNYAELHVAQMLETTSKVLLTTNKKKIAELNNMSGMKHGQVLDLDGDGTLSQLQLQPINKTSFDNYVNKWEQVARGIGSASDPSLGQTPASGVPLGTVEIVAAQGQGTHVYRQGKIADFWQEIYRDWILPSLQRTIEKGDKWLDELSVDEMREVADKVATQEANRRIKRMILAGKIPSQQEIDQFTEVVKQTFFKGGSKRFFEVVKGDFDNLPMDVEVNIANKKENSPEMLNKLNSVFRTLFTPGVIQTIQQNEGLAKILNAILESAGLSPITFTGQLTNAPQQPQQPQLPQQIPQTPQPITSQQVAPAQ